MSAALKSSNSPIESRQTDDRKQSPPAFLDLADSAARLGTNMPDISARVELKRMEHERQRAIQRKMFEDQMRALEQAQAQELLSIPSDGSGNALHNFAVSAPTTPPRLPAVLNGEVSSNKLAIDPQLLSHAVGKVDKTKSVTYASSVSVSPEITSTVPGVVINNSSFNRPAGAKSMPASRRTSASSHDDELAAHLEGLSMADTRISPHSATLPQSVARPKIGRFGDIHEPVIMGNMYNAGMMLDEQLDQEMHNAMRHLPTSDEDKYVMQRGESFSRKLSTSSAALDLAPLSQTPPRTSFAHRNMDSREKPSEWPQFPGRGPDGIPVRNERRTVTTPQIGISSAIGDNTKLGGNAPTPSLPHVQHYSPATSRRSSPLGVPTLTSRVELSISKASSPHPSTDASMNRLPQHASHQQSSPTPSQYENGSLSFGSAQSNLEEPLQQYELESIYGLNSHAMENGRYNGYNFDTSPRANAASVTAGSTALYHHHGSRYGLGMGTRVSSADGKMNGLHGPKHKRGDMDREFNRFAGTRLEDLAGEIPNLCKDQHGCRYLQKKLEEGNPEYRDMIFRETFGHFADLMTDPFGNYLCQKLLEFSTDEQRSLICESVAQDLVNISLNMHGTRAVQKMIDFLSTQRQTDLRYNAQIHSIIVALSLHVVVLIKDLNGNHVIQKCLNKLAPEDNQFIYNAVAANCVEVATHRHGCCVLQRCIDHASDQQRVQLVQEITYNALTLVQDPYGNYVVQYILDLNDNRFSDAVIRQFTGNVCALSVQKFSSNVIEKCIRVAEHSTRKILIEELLNRTRLEKLLRDSFGNYCVQTALDYAEPVQRAMLVEGIRPILPLIRNTPYGKRIQSKLQREQMELANSNPYGSYQHQALVSMGLANPAAMGHGAVAAQAIAQGRHLHHQSSHGQLADVYNAQNALYNLNQPNVGLHNQQALHLQQLAPTLQSHHSIDGYVMPNNSNHSHAAIGSAVNGFNGFNGNGLPAVAPFANTVSAMSDPYQRPGFGYGM